VHCHLNPVTLTRIKALANPDITTAERVGVSPATLYHYLPAARAAHGPDIVPP